MNTSLVTYFPPQKKADNQKTKKWMQDCIDASENISLFRSEFGIRDSYANKRANYNLANDILSTEDIEKTTNPWGLTSSYFPGKMQNYPIALPKIDLLVGEEAKRRFDWVVKVMNMDAISAKEEDLKEQCFKQLVKFASPNNQANEQEVQAALQKLNKWKNFEYQDLRERRANHILKYLYREQELKLKFNQGFHDVLISGEEIYCADIVAGEPVLRRCNPLKTITIGMGESPWVEDSDIIIEYSFKPLGQVIDEYHEYLTPAEIDNLEDGFSRIYGQGGVLNYVNNIPTPFLGAFSTDLNVSGGGVNGISAVNASDQLIEIDSKLSNWFGGNYDMSGNVKVVRVCWKSMRKIGKLKRYDEFGEPQYSYVPEQYEIDKSTGEEVEWFWVNEWWEGTKIAGDIYVKMQPRPVQFRHMNNMSKCGSGYVGLAYNINDNKAKSLLDRMKPYQYLYNSIMYNAELAISKSMGKVMELNLAAIPDEPGWDIEKVLHYARTMSILPVDPFAESKKGASMGKIAGNFNTFGKVYDLEMSNYIQLLYLMANAIKNEMGEIAGVTAQRQGQIENRETVGGVERAVLQSSHITEKWFLLHDTVKVRAMSALLETAKVAWCDKTKKIQYVSDDKSQAIFEVDGNDFNDSEYGIFVSNSTDDMELIQALKQLTQSAIQTDKIKLSDVALLFSSSNSISTIVRGLQTSEEEFYTRQEQQQQQQQEMQQQQLQAQQEMLDKQQELKRYEIDEKNRTAIEVATISAEAKLMTKDMDNNGILDEIERDKLMFEKDKLAADMNFVKEELAAKERMKDKELQHKKEIESQKLNAKK